MSARILIASSLLVALTACARWRFDPAAPRPLPVAVGEPGECEPSGYVIANANTFDVELRLIIDDLGRPLSVSLVRGHDPRSDEQALDLGRNVFACTRPLGPQASRVIPSWLVRFQPLEVPHLVDPAACQRALRYPEYAYDRSLEGSVRVTVAVDETGAVRRAWVHRFDSIGFTEAAVTQVEKCRFTPALVDGKGVATAFHHDVDFRLR
jgi:TonB family protein